MCVNLYFTDHEYAKTNLAAHVMQTQMTDDFRKSVARDVGFRLLEISKSNDKRQECRRWIVDTIGEYAALRALYTPAATYAQEVAAGARHESTLGLFEEFTLYAPKVFQLYFPSEAYQATTSQMERLRAASIAYQCKVDLGAIACVGMNDAGAWFQDYFSLCTAYAEATLRPNEAYAASVLAEERESLRLAVVKRAA